MAVVTPQSELAPIITATISQRTLIQKEALSARLPRSTPDTSYSISPTNPRPSSSILMSIMEAVQTVTAPASSPAPANTPPKVLTYKYRGGMCYVKAANTFSEAIEYASEPWPELRDYPQGQLEFTVRSRVREKGSTEEKIESVRITDSSWPTLSFRMNQYEVVTIRILEAPRSRSSSPSRGYMDPPSYASLDEKKYGDSLHPNDAKRKGGLLRSVFCRASRSSVNLSDSA